MFNWLKVLFGNRSNPTAQANDAAHRELNRLRREELSVGAQLRRGNPVNTFPGLASGSVAKARMAVPSPTPVARRAAESEHSKGTEGDFATSMVIGAATGSTLAGYAMGGSLAGAMVGSSTHQEPSHSSTPSPSFESCSDSSSSASLSSDGCDF